MDEKQTEENEQESVIPGYPSANDYSQQTLKAVLQATKSSNDLPIGDDYDFYSTFSSVRDVLDIEGQRILSLLQRILRHQHVKGNIGPSTSIDLEDRFDVLMDTNDQILERAGTLLDEASGVRKQEAKLVLASTPKPKVSTSWNKKFVTPTNTKSHPAAAYRLLTARNIQRPQVQFRDKIDNSNCPFKPFLREKPNALRTLDESLKLPDTVTLDESEKPEFLHPHPYAFELEAFTPGGDLLAKVKPQEPQPVTLTPLVHVNTVDQLKNLVKDLQGQKEIAVDLEHHSYRSFQGLTCLMQISTRSHDYIVDTIDLRGELNCLNEVFTDPKITKVFHGADSDINWLQRDLGLYVVNMFDTGQASKVLGLPRHSLAHLLMQYCGVEADKQFQLADWRIRPLPVELINYAREDTHYLLYIYDTMRNQLLDSGNGLANLLQSVYMRSKLVASKVYCKPIFKDSDFLELYKKSRKAFNSQQLAALRDMYQWRDQMARMEDESLGYVLPNHMLLQIAEILPREHQGVLACCNPIPPLVRQNLPELHKMVLQAREIAITKVEKSSGSKPLMSQHPKYDSDSLLNCRHDMTRQGEIIANIEKNIAETGLIADTSSMFGSDNCDVLDSLITEVPFISAFTLCPDKLAKSSLNRTKVLADKIRALFVNPFTKFLLKEPNDRVKAALEEMWTLKCSTNKRKPDKDSGEVDLDSFEPEYAPPTKRAKVTVNLTSSAKPSSNESKAKSRSIFGLPPSDTSTDVNNSNTSQADDIKNKITSKLQTLREEVSKAKKRLKQVEEEKKEKTNKNGKNTSQLETAVPPVEKGKKEKTNTNKNEKSTSQLEPAVPPSSDGNVGEVDKKKSKKKNQRVDEEFKGFDYEAAEEQLKKDAAKTKKMDIYNPNLSFLDKKKKNNKKFNKGKGNKSKAKDKGENDGGI